MKETDKGVIVDARVRTGRPCFSVSLEGGTLLIDVASPPSEGKANREIIRHLKKIAKADVEIISGLKSKKKTLIIKCPMKRFLDAISDA